MKSTISLILLLFITIGYSEPEVIKRDNEPDFILTKDKKMDFAIKEAKSKVDEFIQRIKSTKNHEGFFIKKGFTYGKDEAEHIWLSLVSFKKNQFTATVSNKPVYVKNLKVGQKVLVKINEISDWMISSPKGLKGGYTIVALVYGTKDEKMYEENLNIDWSKYDFLKKAK
ncbi:MAG: DUF2314 domain-containing protein [Lentisphaerales bacterium]|nr:DUF2314 domain-containing protein [Lentisphaerales bacterium]